MSASDLLVNVLFYVFAAGAVGGAVAVARSRNIVRSAFSLLAVLVSVAALYAIMKADFIAAGQVLIYVGGILVLIIFAVMLTHRITDVNVSNESAPGLAAACACFCLLFSIILVIVAVIRADIKHDPFQREAEEHAQRGPAHEFALRQWQADGRTGLALHGATHEPAVVLGVDVRRGATDGVQVSFKVQSASGGPERKATVPLQNGAARWKVEGLELDRPRPAAKADATSHGHEAKAEEKKEKPAPAVLATRWQAQLVGSSGEELTPWTSPLDFQVHKGVTRMAAMQLSGRYLFVFEVVSVLLLAALVGAAFLARKEVKGS